MVESLTGYIVRLAEAHCVSAGILYAKEIKALANKGDIFSFRVESQEGYSTHTINGFGTPGGRFCACLRDPHGASRSVLPDTAHLGPGSVQPFLASSLPG